VPIPQAIRPRPWRPIRRRVRACCGPARRIGDKWSVIVLYAASAAPRDQRPARVTKATSDMLSSTLRHLNAMDWSPHCSSTVPPQVEYALTESGESLHAILYQLVECDGNASTSSSVHSQNTTKPRRYDQPRCSGVETAWQMSSVSVIQSRGATSART